MLKILKIICPRRAAGGILILALMAAGSPLFGYEQFTHVVFSQQAFNQSILGQIPYQYAIGAFGINNDFSLTYVKSPDQTGLASDLYALVQLGSWYEDNGARPLNHFFNPVNGAPLPPPFGKTTIASPVWGLAPVGSIVNQQNSYADARQYYWNALTSSDPNVRSTNTGLMYQSLGQVIHLIQDMGQPQHSRDEPHCGEWYCFFGAPLGVYHPSLYETYMLNCTTTAPNPSLKCPPVFGAPGYPAAFDQNNASGTPFTQPRQFWQGTGATAGTGIAEFSNSQFIGARTNFNGTPAAILPSDPVTLPQPDGTGTALLLVPLNDPSIYGSAIPVPATATMAFVTRPVTDKFQGSVTPAVRTSTLSLFASDLAQINSTANAFSYNQFVASAAGAVLVPRAIGYSAGLLNYFFRGQIGVALPHEGVYGIFDQSVQYGPNSNTIPTSMTEGFSTLKFALTNVSPDGEAMQNGTLALIVRFRRNLKFTDTLSNEPGSGSPDIDSLIAVRGNSDETIVATDVFDGGGNLLSPGSVTLTGTAQEFSFQFTNERLPLNSTDVRVEILWRGTLGAEQNTAVVSTGFDISEPSYLAMFNSFDYISIGGKLVDRPTLSGDQGLLSLVQPASCVTGSFPNLALEASCFLSNAPLLVSLDAKNSGPSPQNLIYLENLPAQSYVRVAVLTDALSATPTTNLLNSSPCNIGDTSFAVPGLNNEISIQSVNNQTTPVTVTEAQNVGDLSTLRGINGWENVYCVWDGDGSGTVGGDPSDMVPLKGNSIYPVQVQLNYPQNQ